MKIVHRDNKGVYNRSDGSVSGGGYKKRVPSLKRNAATWRNFYKLYPQLLEQLKSATTIRQIEKDDVIIVKETRTHGGITRVRTIKYRKIW